MRINIIPVKFLTDTHLRAEYREILMAPHYYLKSKNSKKGIDINKIPKSYILNTGHAYFWYDKFKFIKQRHDELEHEMIERSFKIRDTNKMSILLDLVPMDEKVYEWSYEEILINIQRVLEKIFVKEFIENKPNFYRYKRKEKSFKNWCDIFIEELGISVEDINYIVLELEKQHNLKSNIIL